MDAYFDNTDFTIEEPSTTIAPSVHDVDFVEKEVSPTPQGSTNMENLVKSRAIQIEDISIARDRYSGVYSITSLGSSCKVSMTIIVKLFEANNDPITC